MGKVNFNLNGVTFDVEASKERLLKYRTTFENINVFYNIIHINNVEYLSHFCVFDDLYILNYAPVWYLLYAFCIGGFP